MYIILGKTCRLRPVSKLIDALIIRKALMTFKTGGFRPGKVVQPLLIKYKVRYVLKDIRGLH